MSFRLRKQIERLLLDCDVTLNGNEPWDIQVFNDDLYARVLLNGSVGLGEAYMDGWWEASDLDGLIYRLLMAQLDRRVWSWRDLVSCWVTRAFNLQRRSRAFLVGRSHYDVGNQLYEKMLDRRMIYSCGYWDVATNLDDAQEEKLKLVFGRLGLQPDQRILDIGCGWGGALEYAATRYRVRGVGITVSKNQVALASRRCDGLPIAFVLRDYRDLRGSFDHIYSIGMFEHVGSKNHRTYMDTVHRCLRPDGRFLLHAIGTAVSTSPTDPWINKYIFPNSMIPSQAQIATAIDGLFYIAGWQRIGSHYERTLLAWRANFEHHWQELSHAYTERFFRMWRYYLSASAASFRARRHDVWQVLLAPVEA
jgi:cyclopropane-fatty-acyl-phospholipid synthase